MLYQFYEYVHNALNLHFWDIPALVTAILAIAVWAMHRHNQKKRQKEFDEMMDEKIQTIKRTDEGPKAVNS